MENRDSRLAWIGILAAVIATLLWLMPTFKNPPKVEAQYMGSVGLQTDVEGFTFRWTTSPQIFHLKNLGQVGHTLVIHNFPGSGAAVGCDIQLQGSGDNVNWNNMAVLPFNSTNNPIVIFGEGNFTYFRIVVNAASQTCGPPGPFLNRLDYVGYQSPIPVIPGSETFAVSVKTPTLVFPTGSINEPYQPIGGQCFNPNGSTAYLQLFDASSTPTLGTAYNYQVGIGAGQDFDMSLHNFVGGQLFYAGAATTAGGSTAVTNALVCNFQVNRRGPFGSYAGE